MMMPANHFAPRCGTGLNKRRPMRYAGRGAVATMAAGTMTSAGGA